MSVILQNLDLIAYRGISGLALDGLTPVSLVVGANNAGKSSILEAAGLLLRPPDPNQWISVVRQRESDGSLIDGLWSLFPPGASLHPDDGPTQSFSLAIAGSANDGARRVEATCFARQRIGTWGDGTTWGGADDELLADIEIGVDSDPPILLKFPTPTLSAHQVPMFRVLIVTPSTHYSTKTLVDHLSRVVDEGKKQLAVDLLRVFDPNVEDLDVIASFGREAVRVSHRTRGVADLASFGDGMRRCAALALALTRASQGVLLIDEIEAGIHHSVLRPVFSKLLEAAATSQVQILATTHSLEAVDGILGAVEDRGTPEVLSAFWVKRQDERHEVRRYDFEKLRVLREGGLDIR